MQARGETLPTIEELDLLDSIKPLSYLAAYGLYKQVLKSQQHAIDRGDDGRFYNLECTACGNQQYGILTATLMCSQCNTLGCGDESQRWKMANGSVTVLCEKDGAANMAVVR